MHDLNPQYLGKHNPQLIINQILGSIIPYNPLSSSSNRGFEHHLTLPPLHCFAGPGRAAAFVAVAEGLPLDDFPRLTSGSFKHAKVQASVHGFAHLGKSEGSSIVRCSIVCIIHIYIYIYTHTHMYVYIHVVYMYTIQ